PEGERGRDVASTGPPPGGPEAPASPDGEVELLFRAARTALENGQVCPAQFVIPVAGRRWRVISHDLVATGENDFGFPPRAFSYGAVDNGAGPPRDGPAAVAGGQPRPCAPASPGRPHRGHDRQRLRRVRRGLSDGPWSASPVGRLRASSGGVSRIAGRGVQSGPK